MVEVPPQFRKGTLAGFQNAGTKLYSLNPQTDEQRELHWKRFERVRSGFYGSTTNRFTRALNDQLGLVLDNIRASRRPDDAIPAARAALKKITPIYEQALRETFIRVVTEFAELTSESFPKSSFDDRVLKQPEDEWANAANAYVNNHTGTLITGPDATTRAAIMQATRDAVELGLELGWGMDEIADEIQSSVGFPISRARALRIARTEVIRASNVGAMAAADRSALLLNKEWIATQDGRTRDTHLAADQQVVPFDQPFIVGGWPAMFPADARLPPEESVNCRCTVAFITRTV